MRLATIRVSGGTRAVRIDGSYAVETGHSDVGALLAAPHWREQAAVALAAAPWVKPVVLADAVAAAAPETARTDVRTRTISPETGHAGRVVFDDRTFSTSISGPPGILKLLAAGRFRSHCQPRLVSRRRPARPPR
jgi:hypothetical protein